MDSSSSSPSLSPTTPAASQSASRRSGYRVDVQLLSGSARTSIADFRTSMISRSNSTYTSGSTTSTKFSGVGAITGRLLHSIGYRTIHGIEYLVKIRPALKKHREALLALGSGTGELTKEERKEIVGDLLEISKADYLRSFRKQALEILIIIGGKELWVEMNKESRRCVRTGLLEICRNSRLSNADVEFAQGHLEKCVSWDMQLANKEHWYDLSDMEQIANEIREHAASSRKAWAYELLHDVLQQTPLAQSYPLERRTSICKELLDMSIQGKRMARMTWAVESLISFLHLYDWDGCLTRVDMDLMCSSLFALAQKDDSKSGKTRDWALYHLWEFTRLPAWQHVDPAVFSPERWREVISTMLTYARKATSTQQKRAFETLLEFLELEAVGDPLEKSEKQQICKEMLAFSRQASSSKDKRWAFDLLIDLMCVKTWGRLTVKVHRVSSNKAARSSGSLQPTTSAQSLALIYSSGQIGRNRSVTVASDVSRVSFGVSSTDATGSYVSLGSDVIDISSAAVSGDVVYASGRPSEAFRSASSMDVRPPARLYGASWDDDEYECFVGEDIEVEGVGRRETMETQTIQQRRQSSPRLIRPTPPQPPFHLPDVVLHSPFSASRFLPRVSPEPTKSPPLPTVVLQAPFSESPASLNMTRALPQIPPPSPASSSGASSPGPHRSVSATPFFESPASLRVTHSLPPLSPISPSSPGSPRIPSPASSSSSHSQLYREPPRSPAPSGPLPQIPISAVPMHKRVVSVDSARTQMPPPLSPLPPTPSRTVSDSQFTLPPSTVISPFATTTKDPPRPATSPQTAARSTVRRRNEWTLEPVREETRSRPKSDNFLDMG